MRNLLIFLPLFLCGAVTYKAQPVRAFRMNGFAQGTTWQVTYYATDSLVTKGQVDSLLAVIDSSLSIYKSYSLISRFNQAETSINMDDHMTRVIDKSIETYRQTEGIFDITVQPLVQAWGFGPKKIDKLPDSATIRSLKQCVDSRFLTVNGHTLSKTKPCVKIDVNGIAQGYSVDVLAAFLDKQHLANYIVEIGGEIRVKGHRQPGNEKMKIGIEAPGEDEFQLSLLQKIISIDSGAITTSGSYRKFYESAGKKISHIIDPRTGYSSQSELISVTVYAPDAITADAYDNALMVMGVQKALTFIEQRKDMAAYLIFRKPDGKIADTASSRFYTFIKEH
ncbi:FAD:protein FMN transferase [Paraflavitalea soli]|uniref:FAD:protein FMN transferase n=1 Tax=Paraflavitalea soli TaxID=2315862 RepID=A0A3B7MNX4_9BACT|nr:FAD:protein FMN transferase [Paraflavitalea soli]AXY75858.1 FAD:protein FMN transferase [Paraflavitalea soli]